MGAASSTVAKQAPRCPSHTSGSLNEQLGDGHVQALGSSSVPAGNFLSDCTLWCSMLLWEGRNLRSRNQILPAPYLGLPCPRLVSGSEHRPGVDIVGGVVPFPKPSPFPP